MSSRLEPQQFIKQIEIFNCDLCSKQVESNQIAWKRSPYEGLVDKIYMPLYVSQYIICNECISKMPEDVLNAFKLSSDNWKFKAAHLIFASIFSMRTRIEKFRNNNKYPDPNNDDDDYAFPDLNNDIWLFFRDKDDVFEGVSHVKEISEIDQQVYKQIIFRNSENYCPLYLKVILDHGKLRKFKEIFKIEIESE